MLFDSQWEDSSIQKAKYPCIFGTDAMKDEPLSSILISVVTAEESWRTTLNKLVVTKDRWKEAQSWLL